MKQICTFAVVLSALAADARAAEPPPSDAALVAAIQRIKPGDYPSANSVLVLDEQSVVYQADGQFSNTSRTVRLVLSPAGKHAAAAASLDYAKDAETMEVLQARVIRADGTIVAVPAANIKDTEQSGDMNIYDPNGRSVKITVDGVAVGDAVDITSKLTRRTPTRVGFFNDIFNFQSGDPIIEASYSVDGPKSLPLTAEIYHPERGSKIVATRAPAGDRIQYRWTTRNEPQLVPEALMPYMTELPTLIVTTDPSWEHFSTWWSQVTAPQMAASDAIKQKVAELTKDKKTDDEKIHALYDFVAADVRYRGLGVGPRTGYTPRRADDTYSSRWGVCRDVAILLTTMLRTGGFEAYPVLTNVGDPVLPKVAYDGFNHAIVAMPRKGGGWTYLDPTAKNSSDLLPGYEREQSSLVCTDKGEKLGIIPPIVPDANLGHAVAKSVIGPDGSLTSTVTMSTKGVFDLVLRSVAAMMPADQQRETAEQLIHGVLPDAELVDFKVSSALALWSPMKVDFTIKLPHAMLQAGEFRLLRTLVTSGALSFVENVLPQVLGSLPTRKYTLDAHVTFEYDADETVTLPAYTEVLALPNDVSSANAVSAVAAKCTQGEDRTSVTCHRSFQLKSRFIDPKQYRELRGALMAIGQVAHQPVVLGKERQ
jgi:hypothetical protein